MNPPRHHSHTRSLLAAVAVAIPTMLIGSGIFAPSAQAAFIMTLEQVGPNVVAIGSGSLDITNLYDLYANIGSAAYDIPDAGFISAGPTSSTTFTGFLYAVPAISGPTNFGNGVETDANSGSGDPVAIYGSQPAVGVPANYVSNAPLADTATWSNTTLSALGVTSGSYIWTWNTGTPDADSFTLLIGPIASVPAPLIDRGLPVLLAVGGLLFGAKLLERGKKRRLPFG